MKFLKYILLLLAGQFAVSQNVITTESDLKKEINTNGVIVVEFWAEWNRRYIKIINKKKRFFYRSYCQK